MNNNKVNSCTGNKRYDYTHPDPKVIPDFNRMKFEDIIMMFMGEAGEEDKDLRREDAKYTTLSDTEKNCKPGESWVKEGRSGKCEFNCTDSQKWIGSYDGEC